MGFYSARRPPQILADFLRSPSVCLVSDSGILFWPTAGLNPALILSSHHGQTERGRKTKIDIQALPTTLNLPADFHPNRMMHVNFGCFSTFFLGLSSSVSDPGISVCPTVGLYPALILTDCHGQTVQGRGLKIGREVETGPLCLHFNFHQNRRLGNIFFIPFPFPDFERPSRANGDGEKDKLGKRDAPNHPLHPCKFSIPSDMV